jgi:aspartyl-tRNA synthetase
MIYYRISIDFIDQLNLYYAIVGQQSIGKTVSLCGWIHHCRDMKQIKFIVLRDHTGTIQIVCSKKCFEIDGEFDNTNLEVGDW